MLRSESYTTRHQPTDTSTNHRNSLLILSSSRITPAFTQKERKGRLFRLLFPSSCITPDLLLQSLEPGFDVRHLLRTATILCHILGVLQHRVLDRAVSFVHGHTAWVFVYMFTSSTPFSIAALFSASGELVECIRTYFTSSTVLFYTLYLHHSQQRAGQGSIGGVQTCIEMGTGVTTSYQGVALEHKQERSNVGISISFPFFLDRPSVVRYYHQLPMRLTVEP